MSANSDSQDEAVDQALTESAACYSAGLARTRDLFVGVLAHDLRTPLGAVAMSAEYLLRQEDLPAASLRAAANVQRSGVRMQRIINDLLDLTRTRLGGLLPIHPEPANLGNVGRQAITEIGALHPDGASAGSQMACCPAHMGQRAPWPAAHQPAGKCD